jgi:hypothetical protein
MPAARRVLRIDPVRSRRLHSSVQRTGKTVEMRLRCHLVSRKVTGGW